MPVFAFEAIKEDGQKVKSEVTAESKDEAIRKIEDQGLHPTRVKAEKKNPFGSKKSGFKGKKPGGKFGGKASGKLGGKRPESRSAPSNYRAPPMRKPGVPTGAVLAIAAPLVAILFFVVFGSKIFTDTTEVEVLDPNTKIRALEKRVGTFASQYSKVRKLIVEEDPGAEARSEALLNQMQKWMLDWDKVMKPYQDADGYMKLEFKGYSTTRSRVSRIMYDLSKSKGF
ncbi:MAG: hypothetical protein VCD16_05100 [Planctomycetota bacterium]